MQRAADIDELMRRLRDLKARLAGRLADLPSDAQLRDHIDRLDDVTLRTAIDSGPWATATMGGEDVDVDFLATCAAGRAASV